MRWERLFTDVEAQFAAELDREHASEVADRIRAEIGRVRFRDRTAVAHGSMLTMWVLGADPGVLSGELRASGPDWMLLAEREGMETLVPLHAVTAVSGLGSASRAPEQESRLQARLDLGYVLSGIARDRAPVSIVLTDGHLLGGTIDRVGADLIEVAEHHTGDYRRPSAVTGVWSVRTGALALVRRAS